MFSQTIHRIILLAIGVCWTLSVHVHADVFDVYLLAGQSNMDGRGQASDLTEEQRFVGEDAIIFYRNVPHDSDGWKPLEPGYSVPPNYKGDLPSPTFGPEISFTRDMLANAVLENGPRKIALIKGSKGGTSLRVDWNPGEAGKPETQGDRYRDYMETIGMATAELTRRGDSFTIRGLLWHQGESDSQSPTESHQTRLETFIDRIREDLGIAELPIVVGEVFDNGKRDQVRRAIENVGKSDLTLGFVSAEGTSTWDEGTHFDAAGQWLMGERFAKEMIRIQAGK